MTKNHHRRVKLTTTSEALAELSCDGIKEKVSVIGTRKIREGFDEGCLVQAMNSRLAPGVSEVVLNPDAHIGYGAPIGCTLVSPDHIFPGPVGVDIKCSMSLLQLDIPAQELEDRRLRRNLIRAISARTPTGAGKGQRSAPKSRKVPIDLANKAVVEGASVAVCRELGIPTEWSSMCEDASHEGHDGTVQALEQRFDYWRSGGRFPKLADKLAQLGSYGSGNHFGECETVEVGNHPRAREMADAFGLRDGFAAFLSHCGSRGFGFHLAKERFSELESLFKARKQPYPSGDRQLVFAECGTPEANDYLDDMALGGNFATVNHLLINALVLEAFEEVLPGVHGSLVYMISHNIARREQLDGEDVWVHRKGATRAFPAGHPGLENTPFFKTGHPILLPGSPSAGSAVMVADRGARLSCFSINHGAGRTLGRRAAFRQLNQKAIDDELDRKDILTNCRFYPRDEAPAVYKDFEEVLRSVKKAGLASEVARLRARFVIKDADKSTGGAA